MRSNQTVYENGVYSFGWNNGMLGTIIKTSNIGDAFLINEQKRVKIVGLGGSHTLILTADNILYSLGKNQFGQLGLSNNFTDQLNSLSKVTFDDDDDIITDDNIIALACGDQHSLVCFSSGRVFVAGKGFSGQLGLGTFQGNKDLFVENLWFQEKGIVSLSAGSRHSIFIDNEGGVYSCGFGKFGALGHGNLGDVRTPKMIEITLENSGGKKQKAFKCIDVKSKHHMNIALTVDYEVFIWGGKNQQEEDSISFSVPRKICSTLLGRKCIDVATSGNHCLILTTDGSVWTFGFDLSKTGYVQFAMDVLQSQIEKKELVSSTSKEFEKENLDLSEKYVVESCYGGLTIMKSHYLGEKDKVVSVACGENSNFAVTEDGLCYSWGTSDKLELGHGEIMNVLKPTIIPSLQKKKVFVAKVVVGSWHAIALGGNKSNFKSSHLNLGQVIPKRLELLNNPQ